jgi:TRAP-type C4-dicarboxylate transport system permease small subunit
MRIFDCLLDAGSAVSAGLLICIMLATTVKVLFRYGLHTSLIGVDQISGTLMLYIGMLGAGWVLRRDEHVIVDLLLGHVSERARALLLVASSVIGAAVCLLIAVFGAIEVVNSITRGIRIPAEIEMPRAVNLIVIPVGFLFLGLQFVRRALNGLRGTASLPPPPVSVS